MILERAILHVRKGHEKAFESDFQAAQKYIRSIPGYIAHTLNKSCDKENRYLLLVNWESIEAHTIGFRKSEEYIQWKKLLHRYYDPFPLVRYYKPL